MPQIHITHLINVHSNDGGTRVKMADFTSHWINMKLGH